jgi:uncharacterized phage protein (TIGR02218 family)
VKSLPGALATHLATKQLTLATALKITRTDGVIYGFTSHDRDVTISSVLYESSPGLDVTSVVITAGLAVGNLELTTLHDGTVFTAAAVLGGVWRNAAFTLFRYNFVTPADGIETLLVGTIGEVELRQNSVVAELRDLRQYLQQPVGSVSSKTCRYRLGDSKCTKNITIAPFTVTGTLTAVTSRQEFRDSARAEAADFFGEGVLTWTGGANTGLSQKVKEYAANGTFTLSLPMLQTVSIGDTYSVKAGCRKRLAEDCITKFANVLNFGGEPHRPGLDALTAPPEVAA